MPIFSSTGETIPSLSSSRAASRCTGSSSGLPCSEARSFARWTASCALTVNLSQRMGMVVLYFPFCHSERSEEPVQHGSAKLHRSFASLRMTTQFSCQTKTGGGHFCRLPLKSESSFARPDPSTSLRAGSRGRPSPHKQRRRLCGFAGGLGFEGLLDAGADIYFDLLRLGFGLLGQRDLQDALVVVGRDFLGVYGGGQIEGAGEAAVVALHAAVVLFFLFLLDLALAVHSEGVVLHADVDVFLVDSGHIDLQIDLVLVFVVVNGGGKARGGKRVVLAAAVGLAENAVDAFLQGGKLTEWLETGKNGHSQNPP